MGHIPPQKTLVLSHTPTKERNMKRTHRHQGGQKAKHQSHLYIIAFVVCFLLAFLRLALARDETEEDYIYNNRMEEDDEARESGMFVPHMVGTTHGRHHRQQKQPPPPNEEPEELELELGEEEEHAHQQKPPPPRDDDDVDDDAEDDAESFPDDQQQEQQEQQEQQQRRQPPPPPT